MNGMNGMNIPMVFSILSIGNEILSGDISNTNATYLAKRLTVSGHEVRRIVVVPDDVEEISSELKRLREMSDFVIVTGGLGVTHDDVTVEGIAKALNKKLVLNLEAVRMMEGRVESREAIEKMATLPEGAKVIKNDVGAAPGFIVENVLAMPGVPEEMKDIFSKVEKMFGCTPYYEERVRVEGFEDRIADLLEDLNKKYSGVSIGSYPKTGYINIKFSGHNRTEVGKAKEEFIRALENRGIPYREMT